MKSRVELLNFLFVRCANLVLDQFKYLVLDLVVGNLSEIFKGELLVIRLVVLLLMLLSGCLLGGVFLRPFEELGPR
jgi:hypothetical protein